MQILCCDDNFEDWRQQARQLLSQGVPPHEVVWEDAAHRQLLAAEPVSAGDTSALAAPTRIPAQLLEELKVAARYRMAGRWNLLYRILWRVARGERQAMLAGDVDGSELQRRIKAVSREAHHLHAFVRFHPLPSHAELDYVAWHEPAHDILASASLHFAERLGRQRWLIASSRDAVWYDGQRLEYRASCPADWATLAQAGREQHDPLWQSYYSSIFNPARLNPKVMQGHMPLRFWAGLPEGPLIPLLLSKARAGAQRNGQAQAVAERAGKVIRWEKSRTE
ncbi:MAG: TIGR03915 family putative DNA repair protein [Halopseudomonas sp.]|uniref:TIGR03915 family putative DNA repair protein n=1 Tax=Halopseudomonas sp. TaxID=2901191 RepID=UPI0030016B1A